MNDWLQFFREHRYKKLFSIQDLSQLTSEKRNSLKVQMNRLVDSGVLQREARGWYANPFNPAGPEEVAMVLRYPSYLSMEYALSKHGILSQRVYTLTLITTKLPYTYVRDKATYEYHQVKRSFFHGFEDADGVKIGIPEKALLDLIYIRMREMDEEDLRSLIDDMYLQELDRDIFQEILDRSSFSLPFELPGDFKRAESS